MCQWRNDFWYYSINPEYFCHERLSIPADGLPAVTEEAGQPFQDLVPLYQFAGEDRALLKHCLRGMVGNDTVTLPIITRRQCSSSARLSPAQRISY